ncbi:MAG: hypothetical protein VB108_09215 [Anaerolineaceae bacterium]|nr:hypothetical protein [Anaerolineaceae bacterium]
MKTSRTGRLIVYIILILSFISVMWVANKKNGFIYDDYSLIKQANFSDYPEYFSLLPKAKYNDRPVRQIIIKVLFTIFGLQTTGYFLVFICIHLLNVILAYAIVNIFFSQLGCNQSEILAGITAGMLGIFPTSHLAVSWISAVGDLFCLTFLLLSILSFLNSLTSKEFSAFYLVFAFIFYVIGLRTKEMILPLPIILILLDYYISKYRKSKFTFLWKHVAMVFWMILYALILFRMESSITVFGSPYYQSFALKDMFVNFIKYFALFFDPQNGNYTFVSFNLYSSIGIVLLFLITLISFMSLLRSKDSLMLISLLMFGASLITVLPMVNMQHRLYLYIPSFFMGFIFSCFFYLLLNKGLIKNLSTTLVIVVLFAHLYNYSFGIKSLHSYWLSVAQNDRNLLTQIAAMKKPEANTVFYISGGAENGYNIFTYGPGNVFNVLFNDSTLTTKLVEDFPAERKDLTIRIKFKDNIIEVVP